MQIKIHACYDITDMYGKIVLVALVEMWIYINVGVIIITISQGEVTYENSEFVLSFFLFAIDKLISE